MTAPIFLTREQILELHELSLQRHGGLAGLRDAVLLDSALMQPEATWRYGQGDLAAIAAAYAFHLAQNQPFFDGNKRTAVSGALTFLALNGIETDRFDDAVLYDAIIGLAEKRFDKTALAAILRSQI